MRKILDRKKVNFMIDQTTLKQLYQLIPAGERSNFVNESLKESIIKYGRRKAAEEMDKLADIGLNLSTKEFLKLRHNGLL